MSFLAKWQYWIAGAVIAALLSFSGVQTLRLSSAQSDLATEQRQRADERAERSQIAVDELTRQAEAKTKAERELAQKDDEHEKILQDIEQRRVDAVAANGRLRDRIKEYAAGGNKADTTCAVAIVDHANRSEVLGDLLAEGIDLSGEGRTVIERRDVEVQRLLDQIRIDRQTCSPDSTG